MACSWHVSRMHYGTVMPVNIRGRASWLLLALLVAVGGCSSDLSILDTSLASDTRDGRGPFEVVSSIDGNPDDVVLHYRADQGSWAETVMREREDGRWVGHISPFDYGRDQAWPVGTVVEFHVEASAADEVARDPSNAPEGGVHEFVIGTGSIRVLEIRPDEGPESGGTDVF